LRLFDDAMMNVSAKTEYACIAVLELALHYDAEKPLRVRDIAEANGIPSRFLVQILLQLKSAGIVVSERGATGGYRLAREPDQLSLADVMLASEAQLAPPDSAAGRQTPVTRVLLTVWTDWMEQQRERLAAISFADLAELARAMAQTTGQMYYI
jgi:Rrf2 family protein